MSAFGQVVAREVVERARSKLFLLTNAFMLVMIVGGFGLGYVLADDTASAEFDIAVVGHDAAAVVEAAAGRAQRGATPIILAPRPVDDRAAAEALVHRGEVDGALVGPGSLLTDGGAPPGVASLLDGARSQLAMERALAEAGVDPAAVHDRPTPLEVVELGDGALLTDETGQETVIIGLASVLLFVLMMMMGQFVAQGVVEEKQSRVVEVLLSTVTPTQLLAGKVVGLGGLGFAQTIVFVGTGVGTAAALGFVTVPSRLVGGLALLGAWYLAGYAVYALLFAVVGAIVPRVEELNSAALPVFVPLFVAFFALSAAFQDPHSPFVLGAALFPLTAPVVQPMLTVAGVLAGWQIAVAVLGVVALIVVLVPLTARIYANGALATRRRLGVRRALRRVDA